MLGPGWQESGLRKGYFPCLLCKPAARTMGITGLWPILDPFSERVDLARYSVQYGFLPQYLKTRALHLGIDASVLLDGYSAATIKYGRAQHHSAVDTALTQLFTFLCQLSCAPVQCTFVYDGDDRPAVKRGINVIRRQPLLYKKSRDLVNAFGFDVHNAAGDAEAELAVMNQLGIIDAILTRDSDVFPSVHNSKLIVDIYYADVIENALGLTHGGLILYPLLAGNDFDGGVKGFGSVTALAVAQCGYGNSLTTKNHSVIELGQLKREISEEVKYNLHGKLRGREPACAQVLLDSKFPSMDSLNWFLHPPTSWSDRNLARAVDIAVPKLQLHKLQQIVAFCIAHIGWSPEMTLQKCRKKLWKGVIIRGLCSPLLSYGKASGQLVSVDKEVLPYTDRKGRPLSNTNITTIIGCNPPNLTDKQSGDLVRVTFDITDLNELTMLEISEIPDALKKSLNVWVPFAIIAAATGQHHLIPSLSAHAPHSNTSKSGEQHIQQFI
ncbi:PIN domain-like protein [Rhodocollybia butyracea]|uniref:PIN domain-like protein n=1 Tax=Rhodocollybia butyracea TaxID=206335 RepID=A0A9P5Q0M8_9AGAR|nr:PIN domain-like protein [Rhodocollybia butyracea]